MFILSFLPDGIKETDNSVSREMRTTSVVHHWLSRIWHLLRTTPHLWGINSGNWPKNEQTKIHRTRQHRLIFGVLALLTGSRKKHWKYITGRGFCNQLVASNGYSSSILALRISFSCFFNSFYQILSSNKQQDWETLASWTGVFGYQSKGQDARPFRS